MKTLPTTYDNDVLEGLLRLTSQQWSALGVFLHADRPAELVIDPEALLWCSFDVGRYDPRLFDEVIDWLELNHRRINVTRLKTIGPQPQDIRRRILSAVAARLSRRPRSQNWHRLARSHEFGDGPLAEQASVFLDRTARSLPAISHPDPDFAGVGLVRGRLETRHQSGRPELSSLAALLLRARGIFGPDARAYVWAALLTREGASQSDLAEQIGYTKLNIARALEGLVEAGICRQERRRTAKWYSLVDKQGWRELLNLKGRELRWPNWIRLFRGLVHLCRTCTRCNQDGLSEYLFASELRKAFVRVKDDILAGGLTITSPSPDLYLVDEFPGRLRDFLAEVFERALGLR